MDKICGVYGLFCEATKKWYIGQSVDIHRRWNSVYKREKCSTQPKLYEAIKTHGYDGFTKVVLETCSDDSAVLNEKEKFWMERHNSIDNGYNTRFGGSHGKQSEETKRKISQKRKGFVYTDESKKLMSVSQKKRFENSFGTFLGKKHSDKTIIKMSDIHKNMSCETKEKMSLAKLGKKRKPFSDEHKANIKLAWEKRKKIKV